MRALRYTALAACALLSACSSFKPNPPLQQYSPDAGYRFEQLDAEGNSDKLFVILAFSGGGTRAAALSYGVLEALRDTRIEWQGRSMRLLDEVDVISSISGGSFPAAYYALYGEKTFDDFPDAFLYRRVQSDLIGELVSPGNWPKLASSAYGRSDMAADYYDREVFKGGTYADVIARKRRPYVILNATDMTTGTQFPFIQDQFDLLCSDLAGVPLARAAAASSAFPGGLTALTFKNYAGSCGYRHPPWVEQAAKDHASRANRSRTARAETRLSFAAPGPARPYIHVSDGGIADNIGLRSPLDSLTSVDHPWSVLRMINNEKVDKLVVIVVNAATNVPHDRDQSASVPGLVDTLLTAATVPLDNYTADTLDMLTQTVHQLNEGPRLVESCKRAAAKLGDRCVLDLTVLHKVDLYAAQVAFQYIAEAEERTWAKELDTSLQLPRETVDRLRKLGRKLLAEDPRFKALLKDLNGCLAAQGGNC
jgi:NTE family protein